MANLGTIGCGFRSKGKPDQGPRWGLRSVVCGDRSYVVGGKDTSVGNSQPSLRMDSRGVFRFRWVVQSGTRTISVDVKQAVNLSPRPTLVILKNPDVGLSSDTTGTAGSSTGFTTIGPVTITPSSSGAVWVELRANYDGMFGCAPCYWDNLTVT